MIITSTSQLAREFSPIIDGFNPHLKRVCVLQRVKIVPFYRFFTLPAREGLDKKVLLDFWNGSLKDEKFFNDIVEANKYWSSFIGFKEGLF